MTAIGSVIVAVCVAFVISLIGTPFAIRALTKLKAGQPIRDINPSGHELKRGTPTMGGLVFIVGTLVAYVAGHLTLKTLPPTYVVPPGPTITGLVLLGLFVFCGAIGFVDDFLKVRKKNSAGLNKRGKLILQLIVGAVFGTIALFFPSTDNQTVGSTMISFVRDITWLDIGKFAAVVLFIAIVMGTTNGVTRDRHLGHGVRRVHDDLVLAIPALVRRQPLVRLQRPHLLSGPRSAGDRADRGRGRGRIARLPVVERGTRPDLHG